MRSGTKPSSRNGSSNGLGNLATMTSSSITQTIKMADISAWTGNHYAQRRDLVKNNNCRGPDNKGNAALRA
eukprot:2067898-Heterocapsa_arctica.AAC.1